MEENTSTSITVTPTLCAVFKDGLNKSVFFSNLVFFPDLLEFVVRSNVASVFTEVQVRSLAKAGPKASTPTNATN